MFLNCIEKPIQKFFMFISALTFVEPLTDMPIGSVQGFSYFFVVYHLLQIIWKV